MARAFPCTHYVRDRKWVTRESNAFKAPIKAFFRSINWDLCSDLSSAKWMRRFFSFVFPSPLFLFFPLAVASSWNPIRPPWSFVFFFFTWRIHAFESEKISEKLDSVLTVTQLFKTLADISSMTFFCCLTLRFCVLSLFHTKLSQETNPCMLWLFFWSPNTHTQKNLKSIVVSTRKVSPLLIC